MYGCCCCCSHSLLVHKIMKNRAFSLLMYTQFTTREHTSKPMWSHWQSIRNWTITVQRTIWKEWGPLQHHIASIIFTSCWSVSKRFHEIHRCIGAKYACVEHYYSSVCNHNPSMYLLDFSSHVLVCGVQM